MALDDASPQGVSNAGPNSSTGGSQRTFNPALLNHLTVRLRPDLVVKPDIFTLYLGFLGTRNWKSNVADALATRIGGLWVIGGRAPTQDEMDVMTESSSRAVYTKRLSMPITYALGSAWMYYRARQSPEFPKDPTPANLLAKLHEIRLRDSTAFKRIIIQTSFRMLFLVSATHIITSFAATWNETTSTLRDPRMKEFVQDVSKLDKDDVQKRKLAVATERHRRGKNGEKSLSEQIMEQMGLYDYGGQGQQGYDSPSPAAVSSESDMAYGSSQENGQYASNGNQSASMPASRQSQQYGQYGSAQSAGNRSSQADSGIDFFGSSEDQDDASPTAPEYRNVSMNQMTSGSAWDRIRQQNSIQRPRPAATGQAPTQWGQPQAQSNSESASNYTSGDQDRYEYGRRSEKEQAQADFDKMLDAERNASDDGSSRTRTW